MAKSKNDQQEATSEATEAVLKPGNIWVHHPSRGIQRQINPAKKRIVESFTKAGFKNGPLLKGAKPTPPVEAETI